MSIAPLKVKVRRVMLARRRAELAMADGRKDWGEDGEEAHKMSTRSKSEWA